MFYDFECQKCGQQTEHWFSMSSVPPTVKCRCGGTAKRSYNAVAIGINGGLNRTSQYGESIRKRNEEAGKRMRGRKAPVRTVAHDFGNGDIREVKK